MSKTPVQADIAARLKQARARLFSTAAEAAEALGMKAVTLRAHENAQNAINVYDLERYARRYNVNLQWLLTGGEADRPNPTQHVELGEMIPLEFTIEPGAWIPEDHPSRRRQRPQGGEVSEMVPFTDPRFPADMVEAIRVVNCSPDAYYISGTLLFVVEVADIGYRNGDHVLVYRERGDFINMSVRRVEKGADEVLFHSLTHPGEAPLRWEIGDKEELPNVTAVVIGSLTRRPVQELDIETLRRFEEFEASRRGSPRSWRRLDREARAIVAGELSVEDSENFATVEEAKQHLLII